MEYHADRFEDFSLLIFKNEKLVAVFPANIRDGVVYSHQGLTYGGLVLKEKSKFKEVLEVFNALLCYYAKSEVKFLEIKMLPPFYTVIPNDELQYLMFILKAQCWRKDVLSTINLKESVSISKNRMEGYKRGVKNGLEIKEELDFEQFWKTILTPNLQQKHNALPVHTLSEITLLKQRFPENIRQFNVYSNQEIVAGATLFITGEVVHCQYISGNALKNQLGSLDFLFYVLIKREFSSYQFFDFGSSNEDNGVHINQGLQFWKEGFGARTIVQDFYRIDLNNIESLNSVLI